MDSKMRRKMPMQMTQQQKQATTALPRPIPPQPLQNKKPQAAITPKKLPQL